MKSLQRRGETLLRVSRDIIERQSDFLEFGEEAMKPLVLHDVASKIDLDESTILNWFRAWRNSYAQS